jgi:hypothetical protein
MVQVHEGVYDGLCEVVAVVFLLPDPAFGMLEDAEFPAAFTVAQPFAETLEVAGLWLF